MVITKPRHVAIYYSQRSNPADVYRVISKLKRLDISNIQQTKNMDEAILHQILLGMREAISMVGNFQTEPITITLPFDGILMHYIQADNIVTYKSGVDNILSFLSQIDAQ